MKKKLTVITALLLAFMMLFSTAAVYADQKSELDDIQKEIEQKEEELEEGKKEVKRLQEKIEDIEARIKSSEEKLLSLIEEIKETEVKISEVEKDLAAAEAEVEVQNKNLGSRLRAMYKNGSVGFVDILLSSGSVSEFIMNYEMVKEVYASDKEVLEELQENYDIINAKKTELDNLQANLISQKQSQLALQDELAADKTEVAKRKGIVIANNAELEDNISDLAAEAANIEALIQSEESKSEGGSGGKEYTEGKFKWPVPGWSSISSDYGPRICPFHGREFHTGIDIPASKGTKVVAAASGKVVSARYQGSYGNAVLLSHGGGLYTLYAHNSKLTVSAGQYVSKGQQIAKVGSTGSSTGNHLHFEVRTSSSYGSDVSPWNYLK